MLCLNGVQKIERCLKRNIENEILISQVIQDEVKS